MGIINTSKLFSPCIGRLMFFGIVGIVACANALDPLLILRGNSPHFEQAVSGLEAELSDEFAFHETIITKETTTEQISNIISKITPKAVILMDNRSIDLFKKYQKLLPENTSTYIPSIALMGIYIKIALKGLKNTSGIAYEVPIATSAVNLRSIWGKNIKKLGVISREFSNDFLNENIEFCKREDIEIASCVLPNKMKSSKKEVRKGLKRLFTKDKIDALWVSNDNILLSLEIIRDVWIPFSKKYKKPIIVGFENLVDPKFNFSVFGVVPDHIGLGKQAAYLLYRLRNQEWQFNKTIIQPPISVFKIVNYKMAKAYWGLTEDDFKTVDKILK